MPGILSLLLDDKSDDSENTVSRFCTGAWNRTGDGLPSGSGEFTFQYTLTDGKGSGLLTFNDFYAPDIDQQFQLVCENGSDFVPDPAIYSDNPPDLTTTISNGNDSA